MLQTLAISIDGITPILMNRYTGDERRVEKMEALTPEEAQLYANEHAYLDKDGSPYIPAANLQQALIGGGSFCKGKGRGNLSRIVAAALQIREAEIPIHAGPPSIFRNMRKNPSTGGKMLQYRVRIDTPWRATFTIVWDDKLLAVTQVREIVEAAGIRCGLMDWRPQKRGPYGQFRQVEQP